ncbi:enolase-like domain-containing protein [Xanthobacter wiegelii]|uniref:mandelate racemase n=1 Tax=Xanthobacter wiegelii TaxID=3119913 RepID=UPI0037288AF6
MGEDAAPRVRLAEANLRERAAKLRMPFRFGVATLREVRQAELTVRIEAADGGGAVGIAAECLLPKWFDKNPALSDDDNVEQLRTSLAIALELYAALPADTPFGLSASVYKEQQARCAALGLNPLVASYGPALVDRAILDATGRMLGLSFAAMMRGNVAGITVSSGLTGDLDGFDIAQFLGSLQPQDTIGVRHTVGMVDALTAGDPLQGPPDGLPQTLEDVVKTYGCRFYKLKAGGDMAADLDRLTRIAAVLDAGTAQYHVTLDGNEQYSDVEGIVELWRRMSEMPALSRLCASTLYIEQPIRRAVALEREVGALASLKPVMIDESDATLDAFPKAISLGYQGVSSKTCKGFYKSTLNAARIAKANSELGESRFFLSAEDLCTWSGISTQQDLALVSLLGLTHVERNGHHYLDGMSFAPDDEQAAFLAAHPDLYHRPPGGPVRLAVADGEVRLKSLQCQGFAVGVTPVMD